MANPRAASFATYRSLPDDQAALWDDIERVDQDPEIARKRVLVYHLDRQRMSPRRQAVFEEVRTLRSFRLEVRIEVLDEGSIQGYAGHPALRSARADPADPRSGESDGRLRAHRMGFRTGPFTVCLVAIVLDPIRTVGDGRIGILMARSRHSHLEPVHHDEGRSRERVLVAGHFDRQGMTRVGQSLLRGEYFRLDLFRGRIGIDERRHDSIQRDASDPGLGPAGTDPADPRSGEGDARFCACHRRERRESGAPSPARIERLPVGSDEGPGAVGNGRIRFLQARDRCGGYVERIYDDKCAHRGRVLPACYFYRQGVARVRQTGCREHRHPYFLGLRIRIDLGQEGSIQGYPGDTGAVRAAADPAHRRPGEGESGLRAWRRRERGAPAAPGLPRVALRPTAGVGNGRIRFLEASRPRWWRWRSIVGNRHRDRSGFGVVARGIARDGGNSVRTVAH